MRYCVDQLILRLNNLVIVTLAELEIILNGEHRRIWKKAVAPTYLPTYLHGTGYPLKSQQLLSLSKNSLLSLWNPKVHYHVHKS